MKRSSKLAAATVLVAALVVPAVAHAATLIYVTGYSYQRGVGAARLGQYDSTARGYIPVTPKTTTVDANYATKTYKTTFGYKGANGYPIVMYANEKRVVFAFDINSSAYVTSKGVGVGSLARVVREKYPSYVKVAETTAGVTYRLTNGGTYPNTDFRISKTTSKVVWIKIYKPR